MQVSNIEEVFFRSFSFELKAGFSARATPWHRLGFRPLRWEARRTRLEGMDLSRGGEILRLKAWRKGRNFFLSHLRSSAEAIFSLFLYLFHLISSLRNLYRGGQRVSKPQLKAGPAMHVIAIRGVSVVAPGQSSWRKPRTSLRRVSSKSL